jgi:fructose-bisphosphate aldolase class II
MLLTPSQTRCLFQHALKHHYAVLAVNADSHAAIIDCLEVAKQCDSPVIIETSLWQLTGHSFGQGDAILGMARYLADLAVLADSDRYQNVPVVYHTDHIKGPDTLTILRAAIQGIHVLIAGQRLSLSASSISLDSSDLSAEENIAYMRALCEAAKTTNLSATLEMEAGVDDGITELEETRSLFGAVEELHPGYLALWAPGVGTQHGLGPGGGFDPSAVEHHQKLASEIAQRPIGIALHGSSGLTTLELQSAVKAGVSKVNWSSESLLIRSQAAQRYYQEHGGRLTKGHPNFKVTAMDNGVQAFVSEAYLPAVCGRMESQGSVGHGRQFINSIKS